MKSRKKKIPKKSKRTRRVKSSKKSKRTRRVKSPKKDNRIKSKRRDGMKKACKKWERLPTDKMKEYDVTVKTCRICGNTTAHPYLVHSESGIGDYDCYKCGGDVNIRHMCPYCIRKK